MIKALVLYESRYGSTERAAKELARIIGPAKACRLTEFEGDIGAYDFIVLCSPVYSEAIDDCLLGFATENSEVLRQKKVVLLCVCMAEGSSDLYLEPLSELLGDSVVLKAAVEGEICLSKLDGTDRALVEGFCRTTGFTSDKSGEAYEERFVELALKIKALKDKPGKAVERSVLKKNVEEFLRSHNTCVLATGAGSRVRATPIEYMYLDGSIYMLSEGGEKFANMLVNPSVSIGICDPYRSMSELGGMQISGTAGIVELGCEEYRQVLKHRGLDYEKISAMPIALNMLKIRINKTEFLWSGFGRLGCDARQVMVEEGGEA